MDEETRVRVGDYVLLHLGQVGGELKQDADFLQSLITGDAEAFAKPEEVKAKYRKGMAERLAYLAQGFADFNLMKAALVHGSTFRLERPGEDE